MVDTIHAYLVWREKERAKAQAKADRERAKQQAKRR